MSYFKAPAQLALPRADKKAHYQTHHDRSNRDDYFWLRADNWQLALRDPQLLPNPIKTYLETENDYFSATMQPTLTLQKQLIKEMRSRIQEDESGVPQDDGAYTYNWRFDTGAQYPMMIRKPIRGGDYSTLLDANIQAQHYEYFELGDTQVSPDHSLLAFSVDTQGSEYFSLSLRDLNSGKDFDYKIKDVGSFCWCDNETLFYTRIDDSHRPSQIYRHQLNQDPKNDTLVLIETDERFSLDVWRLRSEQFIVLSSSTDDQDELRILPTNTPKGDPVLIEPRLSGLEYTLDQQGDQFIICTNAHDADDFKLVTTSIHNAAKENWKDLIPHQRGRMILSIDCFADWLVWVEREEALPKIKIRRLNGDTQEIKFTEPAYALGLDPSPQYTSHTLRFSYSSPTTPEQIFDYDINSGQRELKKQTIIPSGHRPEDYVCQRLLVSSHDGKKVPVTLLYHRETQLDGSAPCLIYGYGAYGISIPAGFSSNHLSLVDRGFVYAIAHVRGGKEKGQAWYEEAKFSGKTNSFHDLIAATTYLIKHGYADAKKIVCQGGSAGGLLVAGTVNMAPTLFAGVIADVPFVDVLNTMTDASLPLTPGEFSQWGNPIKDKNAYQWIADYCPYQNIKAMDYPAILVTAGVSDPRVTYWEPAKWVAKLREYKTDNNVLLLHTNMRSGHYGQSGRFAQLEDVARSYAFALKVTGSLID